MSVDFHVSFLCYMVRNDNVLLKAVIFIYFIYFIYLFIFAILHYKMVFGDSDTKEPTFILGDLSLIPGLGRSPGEGKGYAFQYFCLENSMNLEA